jgi:hypothetical protein
MTVLDFNSLSSDRGDWSVGSAIVPLLVAALFLVPAVAFARVNLTALPPRERLMINLDDTEHVMVQETRDLPLRKGQNNINFSWTDVRLDPRTVRLIPSTSTDQFSVRDVSYPPDDQALVWNVYSETDHEARVTIRYRLKGFDHRTQYRAIVEGNEREMGLRVQSYLFNQSGENFRPAWVGLGHGNWRNIDWRTGETKRLSVYRVDEIPIRKTYTYDVRRLDRDPSQVETTDRVAVHYRFSNTRTDRLGDRSLRSGKIRLYQRRADGENVFIGEDNLAYQPVGDSIGVYVGQSRDLSVKQDVVQQRRVNVRRDDDGEIVLYDLRKTVRLRVENFKSRRVRLRVLQTMPDEWEMLETTHQFERRSNELIQFRVPVDAKDSTELTYTYVERHRRGRVE